MCLDFVEFLAVSTWTTLWIPTFMRVLPQRQLSQGPTTAIQPVAIIAAAITVVGYMLARSRDSAGDGSTSTYDVTYDNWVRELWNSRERLRPIMHPDQELQQED